MANLNYVMTLKIIKKRFRALKKIRHQIDKICDDLDEDGKTALCKLSVPFMKQLSKFTYNLESKKQNKDA